MFEEAYTTFILNSAILNIIQSKNKNINNPINNIIFCSSYINFVTSSAILQVISNNNNALSKSKLRSKIVKPIKKLVFSKSYIKYIRYSAVLNLLNDRDTLLKESIDNCKLKFDTNIINLRNSLSKLQIDDKNRLKLNIEEIINIISSMTLEVEGLKKELIETQIELSETKNNIKNIEKELDYELIKSDKIARQERLKYDKLVNEKETIIKNLQVEINNIKVKALTDHSNELSFKDKLDLYNFLYLKVCIYIFFYIILIIFFLLHNLNRFLIIIDG